MRSLGYKYRGVRMSKKMIIFTVLSLSIILFGIVMTTIGIVSISTIVVEGDLHSEYLSEDQKLIIYLPPGYDLSFFESYPVLYMLDGERYFLESKEESKSQWSMKKTLDRLIKEGTINKMIVVGIYSTEKRIDNYTPSFDEGLQAGGKLDQFNLFLNEEVKPLIDRKYRTLPDAEHTGIAGSSLAGLASLNIGLNHSDVFSKVGSMTPYLWWNNYEVMEYLSTGASQVIQSGFYLDTGYPSIDDSLSPSVTDKQLMQDIERVRDLVETRNLFLESEIYTHLPSNSELDPDQVQDQRLDRMLQFLYK